MNVETIKTMWASGFVNRWHSHPDPRLRNSGDTTAAHSQRVAMLVILLGRTATVTEAVTRAVDVIGAIMHDAPECFTGDVPYGAKTAALVNTKVAEAVWWEMVRLDAPSCGGIVKLCDMLDAILFCKMVAPDLLAREDWKDCSHFARGWAKGLGLEETVKELLR